MWRLPVRWAEKQPKHWGGERAVWTWQGNASMPAVSDCLPKIMTSLTCISPILEFLSCSNLDAVWTGILWNVAPTLEELDSDGIEWLCQIPQASALILSLCHPLSLVDPNTRRLCSLLTTMEASCLMLFYGVSSLRLLTIAISIFFDELLKMHINLCLPLQL